MAEGPKDVVDGACVVAGVEIFDVEAVRVPVAPFEVELVAFCCWFMICCWAYWDLCC